VRGNLIAAVFFTLLVLSFQNCGHISNSEISSEFSLDETTTVQTSPPPGPPTTITRDITTGFLLNLAFDGKGLERNLSPYVGPLSIGGNTDLWNSAGKNDWPVTTLSLNNTRTNIVTADGAAMENVTLNITGLGQLWIFDGTGGTPFLAYTRFLYSDYGPLGMVTLNHLPAGKYEIRAYAPPSTTWPNQIHIAILDDSDNLIYRTPTIILSNKDSDSLLTTLIEGVQYALFNIELQPGQKLQIITDGSKKSISAAQILMKPF
jgi:hypothetical protein